MRKLAWSALRQIEAIRESVSMTLAGAVAQERSKTTDDRLVKWLNTQGVVPFFHNYIEEGRSVLSLLGTIEEALISHGVDLMHVHVSGSHSRFNEPDIGSDRSSSGWNRLPNFITSSALIRVLGAMEQFEIDVLKALLYYRPQGKSKPECVTYEDAELSIATEEPDSEGRYSKPALWSWIKKAAENTVERRKLYKSVFGIECYPAKFGEMKPSEIKTYYQSLYDCRNALAHGRSLVEVQLSDYCKAEAFVLALVMHLSATCHERYGLGV